MDLNLTENEKAFRDELRQWLAENKPEIRHDEDQTQHFLSMRAWQRKVFEGGWSGISWAKEYGGRGATIIEQAIFQAEMARAGAPELINVIGLGLVGPTLIAMGTEAQKQAHLENILSGDEIWCQGFSEPNSGSDLASLGAKAVRDGDDFVINGQKIWTSYAQYADWCLLLVRTDSEVPKHKGITCLLVDMKLEGITIRPLKMMSGDATFNEIFFTNVRVPVSQVLGKINEGWTTAIAALMNERANVGTGIQMIIQRQLETLLEMSHTVEKNGKPASQDALTRQKLAQSHLESEVMRLNGMRALSKMAKTAVPGPEGSIQKIFWSEMNQRMQQTAQEMLGYYGQLSEGEFAQFQYMYLRSRGNTIEAGTSEIQRNIVAERVLGLPKSY